MYPKKIISDLCNVMNNQNKVHLYDVKRLTGVAILLVVMGHLATGNAVYTQGSEWYKFFNFLINSFHMPLFMFLSGFKFSGCLIKTRGFPSLPLGRFGFFIKNFTFFNNKKLLLSIKIG